jgi:hypothetical protein
MMAAASSQTTGPSHVHRRVTTQLLTHLRPLFLRNDRLMGQITELVKDVAILIVIVVVPGIVAVVLKRQRRRLQRDFVALVAWALSNNEYQESLELIREFLCTPYDIESMWGVFRHDLVDSTMESLQAQMNATVYLREIYNHAAVPIPQDLIDGIVGSIAQQQAVLDDDGLFSVVIGAPRKEFVQSFQAAQRDKERIARLLPKLS